MVKGRGGGALYIEGFSRGGFFFNSIDPAQAQDGVEIRKKKHKTTTTNIAVATKV